MGTRFDVEVVRHFHPERARSGLPSRPVARRRLTLDTVRCCASSCARTPGADESGAVTRGRSAAGRARAPSGIPRTRCWSLRTDPHHVGPGRPLTNLATASPRRCNRRYRGRRDHERQKDTVAGVAHRRRRPLIAPDSVVAPPAFPSGASRRAGAPHVTAVPHPGARRWCDDAGPSRLRLHRGRPTAAAVRRSARRCPCPSTSIVGDGGASENPPVSASLNSVAPFDVERGRLSRCGSVFA